MNDFLGSAVCALVVILLIVSLIKHGLDDADRDSRDHW